MPPLITATGNDNSICLHVTRNIMILVTTSLKSTRAFLLILSVMLVMPSAAIAQSDTIRSGKIITNAKMGGIGTANILDTYLSPEKYDGIEVTFLSKTRRERPGNRLTRELTHMAELSFAENRAGNSNEIVGMYNFSYAWLYNWTFSDIHLDVRAGGLASANIGFIYNMRNSNNPAQMKAFMNIAPAASLTWHFGSQRHPMAVNYDIHIPLAGVMFSPNYGQSCYEIFSEGNYDHNIVMTHPGNMPSLRHMVSLDMQIGRTTMRAGLLGNYHQTDVNGLKTHIYSHSFMIGVVRHFQLLNIRP